MLNCTRRGGTFKGINSVCTVQLCKPQPIRGACCVDGGCDGNGVSNDDDARGFVGCLLANRDMACP